MVGRRSTGGSQTEAVAFPAQREPRLCVAGKFDPLASRPPVAVRAPQLSGASRLRQDVTSREIRARQPGPTVILIIKWRSFLMIWGKVTRSPVISGDADNVPDDGVRPIRAKAQYWTTRDGRCPEMLVTRRRDVDLIPSQPARAAATTL